MPLMVSGVKLYNVEEVAEMLNTTKTTVRAYFRDGTFKGRKISGRWHITEDNLKRFINGEYTIPSQDPNKN